MSNSQDVAELTQRNLDDMSDSEKLQRLLSSKMMTAGMSANGNSQKSTNSSNSGNTGFTPFPSNDYLDIQKKIELYDQTLKETLIAIRDGKLKEQQELLKENMLQQDKHLSEISNGNGNASKRKAIESNSAQSLAPKKGSEINFDLSKKGKNIIRDDDGNEIEIDLGYQYTIPDDLNADVYYDEDEYEIQVEEEIEEEIDDEDDQHGVEVEVGIDVDIDDRKLSQRNEDNKDNYQLDPSRTADQYIEEMVTFINQNKKFDNFLEEVSKLEHFDKFVNQSQSATKGKKKKNSGTSCEFTFEYGKDGELLNTRPDEVIKKKINSQIVKALESFKLDDPLQPYDINLNLADELAKTMQKNMFFGDDDHNSNPDGDDPNIEGNYNNESNGSTYRSGNIENKIELLGSV